MKTCSKCLLEKPPSNFYKNVRMKDKKCTQCSLCIAAYNKKRRIEFPERFRLTLIQTYTNFLKKNGFFVLKNPNNIPTPNDYHTRNSPNPDLFDVLHGVDK